MTTEKELGEALKNNQETIEIEADLAKKVLRIKATGKVAWAICICFFATAIVLGCVAIGSGGIASPIATSGAAISFLAAAPAAVSSMGMPAAVSAIGIAIAGGGVGTLNKLRKYRAEKISDDKIVLHKQ